jgi:hypothetical protein
MSKFLFISGPRALGDAIICNGLYRELANKNELCIIPVRKSLLPSYSQMFADLNNVRFLSSADAVTRKATYVSQFIFERMDIEVIRIGFAGKNFPSAEKVRWDENYYLQANLDFKLRWQNFYVPEYVEKEELLYEILGCKNGPYVFLHEDRGRKFQVLERYLPKNLKVIKPDANIKGFTIFDYRKVINNAAEIHCIESSFSALIESMDLDIPKYAHRYSRPEALKNPWHEYTYRTNWEILT